MKKINYILKNIIKNHKKFYYCILKNLSFFYNKKIILKGDYDKILNNYSPRPKEKTYYSENIIISKEYDLQIVIPAYNVENYIEECINSVLNQKTSYKILIIIINDGSTDGTKLKLKKYEKYDNIITIHQKNQGPSGARNIGIKKIYAKYLMFLDADDILLENAIGNLMFSATKYNLDIVEGSYYIYDGQNFINGKRHENRNNLETGLTHLFGFTCMKVIRAEIFQDICFPLEYQYEDSILAYLIYPKKYKFGTIDNYIYGYRKNSESVTYTLKSSRRNIETYYITEDLIKNGLKLYNIQINKDLYFQFLKQIRLNYIRTINTPEEVKKAIFEGSKNILEHYFFEYFSCEKLYLDSLLEKSLLENNYGKYKFICKYGKDI